MNRRRRAHPARRARRVAGATALGAYAGLVVTVGWAQRAAESATSVEPTPTTKPEIERDGIERLDLSAQATWEHPTATTPQDDRPSVVPAPPPPPSVTVTTTVAPRVTAPPPTAPPATAAPTTTVIAPPTTLVPPPPTTTASPTTTTTTVAPTTTPPPTTIPTGGS